MTEYTQKIYDTDRFVDKLRKNLEGEDSPVVEAVVRVLEEEIQGRIDDEEIPYESGYVPQEALDFLSADVAGSIGDLAYQLIESAMREMDEEYAAEEKK